jgi:hypothetical protein
MDMRIEARPWNYFQRDVSKLDGLYHRAAGSALPLALGSVAQIILAIIDPLRGSGNFIIYLILIG